MTAIMTTEEAVLRRSLANAIASRACFTGIELVKIDAFIASIADAIAVENWIARLETQAGEAMPDEIRDAFRLRGTREDDELRLALRNDATAGMEIFRNGAH